VDSKEGEKTTLYLVNVYLKKNTSCLFSVMDFKVVNNNKYPVSDRESSSLEPVALFTGAFFWSVCFIFKNFGMNSSPNQPRR
jgi:hypothetical protein